MATPEENKELEQDCIPLPIEFDEDSMWGICRYCRVPVRTSCHCIFSRNGRRWVKTLYKPKRIRCNPFPERVPPKHGGFSALDLKKLIEGYLRCNDALFALKFMITNYCQCTLSEDEYYRILFSQKQGINKAFGISQSRTKPTGVFENFIDTNHCPKCYKSRDSILRFIAHDWSWKNEMEICRIYKRSLIPLILTYQFISNYK